MSSGILWAARLAGFIALLAAQAHPTRSADERGVFAITGAGNVSCGEWTRAAETNSEVMENIYTQWVLGFVGGRNAYAPGNAEVADFNSARYFGRQYCANNPLHSIFNVGLALVAAKNGAPIQRSRR